VDAQARGLAWIIGFPLIVAFAWAYELTPEGIRRESELPPSIDIRHASGRRLDYITIGMIAVALLFFVAQRLLAPARESAQSATVDAKSGAAHARSIAVLPFINLSGDSAQAYFTDGITEDLITDLARLPGLMVIARNSSFAYKENRSARSRSPRSWDPLPARGQCPAPG
jgi:hypothetical protein